MTLERFTKQALGREPEVSLRKSESIGLNQAAVAEFFDDAEAVVMLYDEEKNRIGIEPKDNGDKHPNSYTVTRTESGATITPTAFLKAYDLVPEVTTRFRPEWDDDRELVIVDLDNPVGTYGSADEAEDAESAEQREANADDENTMIIGGNEDGDNSPVTETGDGDKERTGNTDGEEVKRQQADGGTADQDDTDEDKPGDIDDW